MRILLEKGTVVNVFTGELERANVLLEDEWIVGVGDYTAADADRVVDAEGRYICPGFIDGHLHIESTMLTPAELAKACVPHGTTAVVTDPHEIANVCGTAGIEYMLQAGDGLPMTVWVMLPSCVPATSFDESGAALDATALEPYYDHPRVLGLAEMMNYPGLLAGDEGVYAKIAAARRHGKSVDGHAPLLSGRDLDRYIAAGIRSDHECTSPEEAKERIRKGQRVMIRQGSAARNLDGLLPLFERPWADRCLLVSDDVHAADLLSEGHIDRIIRRAAAAGKNPITAIRMATLGAAECFGLKEMGAVAPGYRADVLVLDDLDSVTVRHVFHGGVQVVIDGKLSAEVSSMVSPELERRVRGSFRMDYLTAENFRIDGAGKRNCRVIELVEHQLVTNQRVMELDLDRSNGIDLSRDVVKLAVLERHHNTDHRGVGFLSGLGLKEGALASSVAHDSHNLIVIGANEEDMAVAANRVKELSGGCVVVKDGAVVCELPLPVAGLMSDRPAAEVAEMNEELERAVRCLGVPEDREPFMTMAFSALPVIPHLKMTTLGLFDVDGWKLVPLFVEGENR